LTGAVGKTLMTTAGITTISLISSVLTARLLGPEGRGLLSAALMIGSLAAGMAQLGLATSYVYHVGASCFFDYAKYIVCSLLLIIATSAVAAWVGAQLRSDAAMTQVLPWIIALAALMGAQGYFGSLTQLQADLGFFNVMRFGLVAVNLLLLLVVIVLCRNISFEQLLYCQVAAAAGLVLAGLCWSLRHRVWAVREPKNAVSAWQVLRYGAKQHGTVLLSLLLMNFDKIVLLNRGDIKEYGYYALAFTTSRLIGAVQEASAVALYARFAGRDIDQLGDGVRVAFRLTFLPLMVLALVGSVLSPWLIALVYGPAFAAIALPFSILLFECVCGGASWTLAQRFTAAGRPGLVLVRQLISVVPVLLALPFLPAENVYVCLALLMLLGAVLRLTVTLCMFPMTLNETIPAVLPTRADLKTVSSLLPRLRASLN
jgi:O-antigen/teichoic acid export membrane protein